MSAQNAKHSPLMAGGQSTAALHLDEIFSRGTMLCQHSLFAIFFSSFRSLKSTPCCSKLNLRMTRVIVTQT